MRNDTMGLYYGATELPATGVTTPPKFTPRLNEFIAMGGDFRTLYLVPRDDASTFFQMQGDLYIAVNPTAQLTLYLDRGLYGSFEIFGLYRDLPAGGYLKIGRFIPPYGLKLADHTSFIRDDLGFGSRGKETGVEGGVTPGPFTLQVAVVNGNGENLFDENTPKAVSLLASGHYRFFTIGGSFYRNETPGGIRTLGGVFGTVAIWKLVYLGEGDWETNDPGDDRFAAYHELDVAIRRGIDVEMKYDFIDPSRRIRDDARHRVGAGVSVIPVPSVEVEVLYYVNRETPNRKNDQFVTGVHVWF
jgi:hypothetical protein